MSIVQPFHPRPASSERMALLGARRFFAAQGEALAEAAGLVAGPAEAARAAALAARVAGAARLGPGLRAEFVRLHRLLSLRLDPAHGADLHPDDPKVHVICLMTDEVADLLALVAAEPKDIDPAPAAAVPVPKLRRPSAAA